ncbi:hypothetical protein [Desulfogranum mediterraneum]|uniref:hypothetical protein n=1 Tax=Desulfogranum mediterraneum TaxID=160661 RepID=UPI00055818E9|nr:hypothetical protein [Desulfogranum mediterraneum]
MTLEKLVADLKKVLPLKPTTSEGDIVIIAAQEPQLLSYAVVCSIEPDPSRRDQWWHVTMQLLSIPPQKVTWTLRTPQFNGQETFTMGGNGHFIQAVDFAIQPGPEALGGAAAQEKQAVAGKAKDKAKGSNVFRIVR